MSIFNYLKNNNVNLMLMNDIYKQICKKFRQILLDHICCTNFSPELMQKTDYKL